MSFQQPLFLLGLLALPLLVLSYLLAQRRRRAYTMRFTNLALLQAVAGRRPGARRHLPPGIFLLGAAGLLLAMSGPILNLEVARKDASVMLVIDTSGSMRANDVQPSRLEAARTAARTLINQLPSNSRVGLVSFSGTAHLQARLTDNRDSVQAALDSLQPGGATAIGDALILAVHQLAPTANQASGSASNRPPAMIVLLTDGVSNAGANPLVAAQQARAAGIPVQTIGIGVRNANVQVQGQEVGGVDEAALQTIADATGGRYYYAEEAGQLKQIYNTLGSQFAWRFVRFDATVPLIVAGTLMVLVAASMSLLWFRVLP